MDPFSQLPKKKKFQEKDRAIDPFVQLPTEMIQTILSFLSTKETARASILSKTFLKACSTNPYLRFCDSIFSKVLFSSYDHTAKSLNQNQEVEKQRERFTVYVDHTLTRYQEENISIKRLFLRSRVDDDKTAYVLEQCVRKAKEHGVKELHLCMLFFPSSKSSTTLLQAIFALKDKLHILELFSCNLVKDIVQDDEIIIFSSLSILKLAFVKIDKQVLQKLIHSCPLLKKLEITYWEGPETIQVANLPNLKWLHVSTVNNQMVDVKAANLEIMTYQACPSSPYLLNIESTRSLKELSLICLDITEEQLHNLISKFPVLEKLILEECNEIQKINVSSQSLSFLRIKSCRRLIEVKIDALSLNKYEYFSSILPQ